MGIKKRVFSLLLALIIFGILGLTTLAAAVNTGFSDVAADAWYADAVEYVQDHGLMSGTSATTFSPNTTSRAMLATILYRRAGSPAAGPADFSDVPVDAWYARAAGWAAGEGIISGYSDGRFDRNVSSATITNWADRLFQQTTSPESGSSSTPAPSPTPTPDQEEDAAMSKLTIQVGNQTFTATLEDNDTTRAFVARLPMAVSMGELNGNEKYYYLPTGMPTNSQRPGTLHTGDLMLYGSDCLVLFYKTFSSGYSYTRMGRVDDTSGLAAALGQGSVSVTFRID